MKLSWLLTGAWLTAEAYTDAFLLPELTSFILDLEFLCSILGKWGLV